MLLCWAKTLIVHLVFNDIMVSFSTLREVSYDVVEVSFWGDTNQLHPSFLEVSG